MKEKKNYEKNALKFFDVFVCKLAQISFKSSNNFIE